MTKLQERPDLRASVMGAYDKWDRNVRRPARRRRIAAMTAGVVFALGSLWSGFILFQNRATEEIAVVLPPPAEPISPNPPISKVLPRQETSSVPSNKPASAAKVKKPAPVFRGAETKGTIRLTTNAQCIQGTDIQMVTGIQAPVEVKFFMVTAGGEIWKVGRTGTLPLKMVSGNAGFILPTESGAVTILFSSPLIEGKELFGTKVGTATSGSASISIPK